jgi:hypothetical protein
MAKENVSLFRNRSKKVLLIPDTVDIENILYFV